MTEWNNLGNFTKTNINYIEVLRYLEQNCEVPYRDWNSVTDEKEQERLIKVEEKGKKVANELKKMADLCDQRFQLKQYQTIPWLDNSGTKTRKYLQVQMKYPDNADNPISISIFVEMKNDKEAVYRISLDIKDDTADKEAMERYHSHLDLSLNTEAGLIYVSGSNQWGRPEKMTESQDQIRADVKAGKIRKVQVSRCIDQKPDQTNEYFEQALLTAVEALIPYYRHVVGEDLVVDIMSGTTMKFDKNMILYGPPGTGKTYSSAIYAVAICDGRKVEDIKAQDYSAVMDRYHELQEEGRVAFTTFHQSYGYEEFIEGIKPVMAKGEDNNTGNDIKYDVFDGVFKAFCEKARTATSTSTSKDSPDATNGEDEKPYVFVIDEINRGNISKIFGELITLIEDTKREGLGECIPAILPYSGEEFTVPQNVYLLGTMNTADRSIALMDTALRRRFQFVELMPDADVLRAIGADDVEGLDVAKMLEQINERITFLYDREHTIGHAFFTKLKDSPNIETLSMIFQKSIIPLLQEYFYEDYQKIQLVLGDNGKSNPEHKFILDEEVKVKSIFKGSADDVVDLPEKKYTINKDAFEFLDAYKEIIYVKS